jgi:MFS family permease
VAQDLYPNGIGTASSLYFSALRFSAAIGGIAGALGVGWFGVPGVFLIPALLCLVAAVGLMIQAIVRHRTPDALAGLRVGREEYGCPTAERHADFSAAS